MAIKPCLKKFVWSHRWQVTNTPIYRSNQSMLRQVLLSSTYNSRKNPFDLMRHLKILMLKHLKNSWKFSALWIYWICMYCLLNDTVLERTDYCRHTYDNIGMLCKQRNKLDFIVQQCIILYFRVSWKFDLIWIYFIWFI